MVKVKPIPGFVLMITVGIWNGGPLGGPGPEVNYSAIALNFRGQIRDPGGSKVKCCVFILVLTCLCLLATKQIWKGKT